MATVNSIRGAEEFVRQRKGSNLPRTHPPHRGRRRRVRTAWLWLAEQATMLSGSGA